VGRLLRKLKAMMATAVLWGTGWFGVSALWFGVKYFGAIGIGTLGTVAGIFGVTGAMVGAGFAVVLGVAEGKHSFEELSYRRLAGWGAAGGLLVGVPLGLWLGIASPLTTFGLLALFGAGSAAGTLAIARRAEDRALGRGTGAFLPELD
jgi:hypothetical protein